MTDPMTPIFNQLVREYHERLLDPPTIPIPATDGSAPWPSTSVTTPSS
jgi:hypothetical protein